MPRNSPAEAREETPQRLEAAGGRGDARSSAGGCSMIDGLIRIALRRHEDPRGWFMELRRESALPKGTLQTNVSFSRRGVIRGLHSHEQRQADLFACLRE